MTIHPLIKTLLRNKIGVGVIATQVALTLAIASNVFYIVGDRIGAARKDSGVDEANLFRISAAAYRDVPDAIAQQKADEAVLRAIPGVRAVALANQMPLARSGNNSGFFRQREDKNPATLAATYQVSDSPIQLFGLELIDGSDFEPGDYYNDLETEQPKQMAVIISEPIAKALFPDDASVVGKIFYFGSGDGATELRVRGVVRYLATPWGRTPWGHKTGGESLIFPSRSKTTSPQYVVRTEPGRVNEVLKAAEAQLVKPGTGRILLPAKTFAEFRENRYRSDYFLSNLMGLMTALLVLVTASGILGMASFWVGQRRKQIGVRRALGARRSDIVRHYLLENFIVTSVGIGVGVVLALSLNQWVAESLQLSRLPIAHLAAGMALLWFVGQIATLAPARRAAMIPPATATRSV